MMLLALLLLTLLPQTPQATCGSDGYRVQVVYRRGAYDRYTDSIPQLRQIAESINQGFGGVRVVRYVRNCEGQIDVLDIPITNNLTRPDRKYLVFVDAQPEPLCGNSLLYQDDQPGQGNLNNNGAQVSLVYKDCWGAMAAAHELLHNLGAVQASAPHSTGLTGHCWDGRDIMCLPSDPKFVDRACPSETLLYNCNGDDYYNPHPAQGSYLDTHWNIANSRFLDITIPKVYQIFIP